MKTSAEVRLDSSHPRPLGWMLPKATATRILLCDGRTHFTELRNSGELLKTWDNPLEALSWVEEDICRQPAGVRWVGYLSYDLGRLFERIPSVARDDLGLPLFAFAQVDLAATSLAGGAFPPLPPGEGRGGRRFSDDARCLRNTNSGFPSPQPSPGARGSREAAAFSLASTFTREQYFRAVERILEYVRAGDVFQVNLSQRFTAPLSLDPQTIYSRLLSTAPAWYGGMLDFGDHALICNSPELFLHVAPDPDSGKRRVHTRPIKGTRRRLPGMDSELLHSLKDQAELNMIIDMERNDLGRVCETGSVKVTEPRTIETHPTVFHGAATISGTLRDDVSFVDLLRATFPGGSITGAPKIRAMQIIDELEPVRRGPYCGAIGYLASDGTMTFNIAIRTMTVKDNRVHIPVGGGIVADSRPSAEYQETLVKAAAMFEALGLDSSGI